MAELERDDARFLRESLAYVCGRWCRQNVCCVCCCSCVGGCDDCCIHLFADDEVIDLYDELKKEEEMEENVSEEMGKEAELIMEEELEEEMEKTLKTLNQKEKEDRQRRYDFLKLKKLKCS